jgi:arylsulfatase
MPFLNGEQKESPREGFLYWSDDGDVLALRVNQWKAVFEEQRHTGLGVWREPFSSLRAPKIFNLRSDPFERGDESFLYDQWMADRAFLLVPAQAIIGKWLESFKDYPPRAKAASFSLDRVVEALMPKS